MTTSLDKQAREYIDKWLPCTERIDWTIEALAQFMEAFANNVATQVREQTVEECAGIIEKLPLGYRTEDEHEKLEQFSDKAIALIRGISNGSRSRKSTARSPPRGWRKR